MRFNFWSWLGLFWLVVLIALAVAGIWLGLSLQRIQSSYPRLSPNVPLAAEKSYGVNADLTQIPPEELDRTLTQMRQLSLRILDLTTTGVPKRKPSK